MKKLICILTLAFLGAGIALAQIDPSFLPAYWSTKNSNFAFRPDGTWEVISGDQEGAKGGWSLKNNILTFILRDTEEQFKVTTLTKGEFILEAGKSRIVYHRPYPYPPEPLVKMPHTPEEIPIAGLLTGGTIDEALQSNTLKNCQNIRLWNDEEIKGDAQKIGEYIKTLPIPKTENDKMNYYISAQPETTLFGLPLDDITVLFVWDYQTKKYIVDSIRASLDTEKVNIEEAGDKITEMLNKEIGPAQGTWERTWENKKGKLVLKPPTISYTAELGYQIQRASQEAIKKEVRSKKVSTPTQGIFGEEPAKP